MIGMEVEGRLNIKMRDGQGLFFSDAHYWPQLISTAHRALVRLAGDLKPELIVANGDVLDGARISKHPRIGWQRAPKLSTELETCGERLEEIKHASSKSRTIWTLGNHDQRFEKFLANNAPEFAGIVGFSLREHFPEWEPCWSILINDETMIKHRWKGGENATLNNVKLSGINIFTGHLHSQRITPYTDYRGTRYGVDLGTLADPYGPQFTSYTEDACVNWRSGFILGTWYNGKLLCPEPITVIGRGKVSFRGKVLEV